MELKCTHTYSQQCGQAYLHVEEWFGDLKNMNTVH